MRYQLKRKIKIFYSWYFKVPLHRDSFTETPRRLLDVIVEEGEQGLKTNILLPDLILLEVPMDTSGLVGLWMSLFKSQVV